MELGLNTAPTFQPGTTAGNGAALWSCFYEWMAEFDHTKHFQNMKSRFELDF